MAELKPGSLTRSKILKTTNSAVVTVAVATAISVFCLVSAKALFSQATYQRKVLHERRLTLVTLNNNKAAANTLINQYNTVFENSDPINIIGGKNDKSSSTVPPDGDNARIVLDSLPTSYDFPALISSVSYILNTSGVSSPSINGTDQSASASNTPSANPAPVPIQLSVSGNGNYSSIQRLINNLERSTRPFDITNIQLAGSANSMTFNLQITTYYQPGKTFNVGSKEVN